MDILRWFPVTKNAASDSSPPPLANGLHGLLENTIIIAKTRIMGYASTGEILSDDRSQVVVRMSGRLCLFHYLNDPSVHIRYRYLMLLMGCPYEPILQDTQHQSTKTIKRRPAPLKFP